MTIVNGILELFLEKINRHLWVVIAEAGSFDLGTVNVEVIVAQEIHVQIRSQGSVFDFVFLRDVTPRFHVLLVGILCGKGESGVGASEGTRHQIALELDGLDLGENGGQEVRNGLLRGVGLVRKDCILPHWRHWYTREQQPWQRP